MSVRSRPMALGDHVCLRFTGRRLRWEEERAEVVSNEVKPGIDSVSRRDEETEVRVCEGMMRLIVLRVIWQVNCGQSVGGEGDELSSLA